MRAEGRGRGRGWGRGASSLARLVRRHFSPEQRIPPKLSAVVSPGRSTLPGSVSGQEGALDPLDALALSAACGVKVHLPGHPYDAQRPTPLPAAPRGSATPPGSLRPSPHVIHSVFVYHGSLPAANTIDWPLSSWSLESDGITER